MTKRTCGLPCIRSNCSSIIWGLNHRDSIPCIRPDDHKGSCRCSRHEKEVQAKRDRRRDERASIDRAFTQLSRPEVPRNPPKARKDRPVGKPHLRGTVAPRSFGDYFPEDPLFSGQYEDDFLTEADVAEAFGEVRRSDRVLSVQKNRADLHSDPIIQKNIDVFARATRVWNFLDLLDPDFRREIEEVLCGGNGL